MASLAWTCRHHRHHPGFVVNGGTQAWPYLAAKPTKYRLRLLNSCDSRFLVLTISCPICAVHCCVIVHCTIYTTFTLFHLWYIWPSRMVPYHGKWSALTEAFFLSLCTLIPYIFIWCWLTVTYLYMRYSTQSSLLLSPGERMDVIVDLTGTHYLTSNCRDPNLGVCSSQACTVPTLQYIILVRCHFQMVYRLILPLMGLCGNFVLVAHLAGTITPCHLLLLLLTHRIVLVM